MKVKIQLLLVFITCLIIASCSSDDEGNVTLTPEGQWLVSSLLVESSFDFDGDGNASRDLFQETSCYDGNFIEFFDSGNVTIDIDFTYIFVNNNNEQDFECQNGFGLSSTWTQNGNVITVTNDNEQGNIVGTISGNTLTVTILNGFEMELYDEVNNQTVDVTEDFTIVFTKS
ncbi:hypothetical protein [Winogradskyella sp.]|jgi:hypothetical protein|uniref:hypothetical protein n=1 Tax=Winogradskyella sp. TaxID=1883156 RepID=UPI0025E41EFA|nr:hypothetical protein [Winogradskyella sp.]MCT4630002.1 hypothetical protein [Winogradskyella sp.]